MAMMPSGSGNGGGSSSRTGSPFIIENDDDSGLDGDLIGDDCGWLYPCESGSSVAVAANILPVILL